MSIVAIIQARMTSSRLPQKVLLDIAGRPMLWHVIERASKAEKVDKVIVATTDNQDDDMIERFARENKIGIYRGSENNCLDRYYQAAKKFKADTVIRITADCPLVCPEIIDKVVSTYLKGSYDYVTNSMLYTYPDGCDVEIFSFKALKKMWQECKDPVCVEHVTPYLKISGKFKIKNIENEKPVDPSEYKWSIDRSDDLKFVREVYKYLYKGKKVFTMNNVLALLKKRPDIKKINSRAIVDEGDFKSILRSPKIKPAKKEIKKSLDLKKRAERLIPGCSQTFSKAPFQFVQGVAPVFLEKGRGSKVWDIDGNEYIDYAMALAPVILGHNYPSVTNKVKSILNKGTTFTLPHRLESELAQLLCDIIPCAEMVRFGKNGSDATAGAVRVARAYTGKDKIACCGYHGWQDWYIATTTRNEGIPKAVRDLTLTFEYNNIDSLKRLFEENKNQIACVIMEPTGITKPKDNFLQKVKDLAHKNGAVLIFDEIVTGFRLSLGGAQEYFNVIPDLACFGKAMANGFPISAVVGNRKIMKLFEDVFYSFTFGGEIVSIAASIATINEIKKRYVISHLWERGRKIKDGYNYIAKAHGLERYTECIGFNPRTIITLKDSKGNDDLVLKSLFQQECIKRGILFAGSHNICFSHSNRDVDYTLRVYNTVLGILRDALHKNDIKRRLKGRPVEPVFRKA